MFGLDMINFWYFFSPLAHCRYTERANFLKRQRWVLFIPYRYSFGDYAEHIQQENERKVTRHIQRIRRKHLSVNAEFGEFRVVCGTKNHLRMRRIRVNNLYIPSNAQISTPFFQKTVFFSKICFGNPPKIFRGMSKFRIYVKMKSSLQF